MNLYSVSYAKESDSKSACLRKQLAISPRIIFKTLNQLTLNNEKSVKNFNKTLPFLLNFFKIHTVIDTADSDVSMKTLSLTQTSRDTVPLRHRREKPFKVVTDPFISPRYYCNAHGEKKLRAIVIVLSREKLPEHFINRNTVL